MNEQNSEDADVPVLAVEGLNAATRKALQAGDVVVVRGNQLLKISPGATIEVLRLVPGRKKVSVRVKKIKK